MAVQTRPRAKAGTVPVRGPLPAELKMRSHTYLFLPALVVVVTFTAAAPLASHGETSLWARKPPSIPQLPYAGPCRCAKPKVPESICSRSFLSRFFLTPGLGAGEQVYLPRPGYVPLKGSTGTLGTS